MAELPEKIELEVIELEVGNAEPHGGGFYVTLGPFDTPESAAAIRDALALLLEAERSG